MEEVNLQDYLIEEKQMIFANIFILANRLQTACEKIQTDITIKQWLMLAIALNMNENRNLSQIGNMMGCSRQNIKKLAKPLEEKGYIKFIKGSKNSLNIEVTDKFFKYSNQMKAKHLETLTLLFKDFTDEEITQLFSLYNKLESGLASVEEYGEKLYEGN